MFNVAHIWNHLLPTDGAVCRTEHSQETRYAAVYIHKKFQHIYYNQFLQQKNILETIHNIYKCFTYYFITEW